MDAKRCLRFNWEQRVGFLAVSDLDGSPYLHLCENRPYELLSAGEIDHLIAEIGPLGDRLEQAISPAGRLLKCARARPQATPKERINFTRT